MPSRSSLSDADIAKLDDASAGKTSLTDADIAKFDAASQADVKSNDSGSKNSMQKVWDNPVGAGFRNFAYGATFGLEPKIIGGLQTVWDAINDPNVHLTYPNEASADIISKDYQQNVATEKANIAKSRQDYPLASNIGQAVGAVASPLNKVAQGLVSAPLAEAGAPTIGRIAGSTLQGAGIAEGMDQNPAVGAILGGGAQTAMEIGPSALKFGTGFIPEGARDAVKEVAHKFGGEVANLASDAASKLSDTFVSGGPGPLVDAAKGIMNAAKEGSGSALATMYILQKGNPDAANVIQKGAQQ